MSGLCECGCGQQTRIRTRSDNKRGAKRGEYARFVKGHHRRGANFGIIIRDGYRIISTGEGQKREHRIIVEQVIGRELSPDEIVHHIDGNRANNNPDNLMIFPNHRTHAEHHAALRAEEQKDKGKFCRKCGKIRLLSEFYRKNNRNHMSAFCKQCICKQQRQQRNALRIGNR